MREHKRGATTPTPSNHEAGLLLLCQQAAAHSPARTMDTRDGPAYFTKSGGAIIWAARGRQGTECFVSRLGHGESIAGPGGNGYGGRP